MNVKLSKILKLMGELGKLELIMLNKAIISLIKTQEDVDFKKAAIIFNKGDIVSFMNKNVKVHGVVTKKNPKTVQVTTPDNYYINIPAVYLRLENKPSNKLVEFRKQIAPTHKDMSKMLANKTKKSTFH